MDRHSGSMFWDGSAWIRCLCDQCADTFSSTSCFDPRMGVPTDVDSTVTSPEFSQFTKHGKKIVGIGRNYRWTKVELAKVLAVPKQPIVFLKPTSSYIAAGQAIKLPKSLGPIFYELELGVVIGKKGKNIRESHALEYVAGYFLALDMTAKDFIKQKPNQSTPWEIGKGFDTASPVGEFIPKSLVPDPNNLLLECRLNGELTQRDSTSSMIFKVQELIAYVSKYMTLEPHDTLLTGTPDGFGSVKDGDVIEGTLGDLSSITFKVILDEEA